MEKALQESGVSNRSIALNNQCFYLRSRSKDDAKNGENLFKANCSACHALDKQMVGPALGGVVDRIKNGTESHDRLAPKVD